MNSEYQIPEPVLFSPFKHHLEFIKEFINFNIDKPGLNVQTLTRDLRHLGTSVMDIYRGSLSVRHICNEVLDFLEAKNLINKEIYSSWSGTKDDIFRIITLTDSSEWTLKYHESLLRYVHVFPARNSPHTFRVKGNTLKSAVIYNIIIGKDMVTGDDLNKVRPLLGLSPVKNPIDTKAILEMIEILRE